MVSRLTDLTDNELIRFLLYQQFYYGDDTISGRFSNVSCHIEGSGAIIERLYGYLIEDIEDIRKMNHKEYLEKFNEKVYPINVDKILNMANEKYEILEENQLTPQIIASILIGELLMEIKKECFNQAINEIKIILIEKVTRFNKEINQNNKIDLSEDFVESKMKGLRKLFSLNDGNIGIIYNLAFLQSISFSLSEMEVYKNTNFFH